MLCLQGDLLVPQSITAFPAVAALDFSQRFYRQFLLVRHARRSFWLSDKDREDMNVQQC